MNHSLSGKAVVITGATSGIGFTTAKNIAQAGAFVIGVGRSEQRNQFAENEIDTSKGYYFRDCQFLRPSRKARNPQLTKHLWQYSCELTGLYW
ncbi:MAG: SDR family NAD(P)-dependent oxidoreductase [Anaerolineales bacterium]